MGYAYGTPTAGDDVIVGSDGDEWISGLGGNDTLVGRWGADTLDGGDGEDVLEGGAGNDTLHGGAGYDMLYGGLGVDHFDGGDGPDELFIDRSWEAAAYTLLATDGVGTGSDGTTLTGVEYIYFWAGAGNNSISARGFQRVYFYGNDGDDTFEASECLDGSYFRGGAGNDTLLGSATGDFFYGEEGNDYLRIQGSSTIYGGEGDDTLVYIPSGSLSRPYLAGQEGNDFYFVKDGANSFFEIEEEYANVDFSFKSVGHDTLSFEQFSYKVRGGMPSAQGGLRIFYDASGNSVGRAYGIEHIIGSAFDDTFFGSPGDDTLDGGAGTDTLTGMMGDDTYVVDSAGDVVTENVGEGSDTVRASVTYILGANLENLVLTGAAAIAATGNGLNNVLTGNSAANTLTGGLGDDTLDGGSGADSLSGGAGDDLYVVDDAGDLVVENAGEGTDSAHAAVTYALGAHVENLVLTGDGDISGTGSLDDNRLVGNGGANTLDGFGGDDTMEGGAGDDVYIVGQAGDVVVENPGEGIDSVRASVSYALGANAENLVLTGSAAIDATGNGLDNVLTGNVAANTLVGDLGNDTLDGGKGGDRLEGGAGDDTYWVDNAGDAVIEGTGQGTDTVYARVNHTLAANLERLILGGSDDLSAGGNDLDNRLDGNNGDNLLSGGLGDDELYGAWGADTLEGGAGNDTLYGGGGHDVVIGGAGDDLYYETVGVDTVVELVNEGYDTVRTSLDHALAANVERLILTGSADLAGTGNALDNRVDGNLGNNLLSGGDGNDTLHGGGGEGCDTLEGGAGADTLSGGLGLDRLAGGAGDDLYYLAWDSDEVVELAGEGYDTVRTSFGYSLPAHVERLIVTGVADTFNEGNDLDNRLDGNLGANALDGGAGNDTLSGGGGDDTLAGGTGADSLNGGTGDDVMRGGAGDDCYWVNAAGDVVEERAGEGYDTVRASIDHTLSANVERLILRDAADLSGTGNDIDNRLDGNLGANLLDGGAGNDTLYGGAGDDTLVGGLGRDWMNGGAGADRFLFAAAADSAVGSARDVVAGFDAAAGDRVDLSAMDSGLAFVGAATFTGAAGELRFASGLLQADIDGDGVADFELTLIGVTALTAEAFIL